MLEWSIPCIREWSIPCIREWSIGGMPPWGTWTPVDGLVRVDVTDTGQEFWLQFGIFDGSGFRVERFETGQDRDVFTGRHNGYARLDQPVEQHDDQDRQQHRDHRGRGAHHHRPAAHPRKSNQLRRAASCAPASGSGGPGRRSPRSVPPFGRAIGDTPRAPARDSPPRRRSRRAAWSPAPSRNSTRWAST